MRTFFHLVAAIVFAPVLAFGAWQQSEQILSSSSSPPYISGDSRGNVIAVWVEVIEGKDRIATAFHKKAEGWSPTGYLSGSGYHAADPKVSCNSDGRAVVIWTNRLTDQLEAAVSANIFSSRWSAPRVLSKAGASPTSYSVAISPSTGSAFAVWIENSREGTTVQAANLFSAHSTNQMLTSSDKTRAFFWPTVSVNGFNQAVAVWAVESQAMDKCSLEAAVFDGERWDHLQQIAVGSFAYLSPTVKVDDSGGATALWQMQDGVGVIQAASFSFSSLSWSWPETLSLPGVESSSPSLALNRYGDAYAAWAVPKGVEAAFRPFNGFWGTPEAVADGEAASLNIAMNDSLDAMLVWQSNHSLVLAAGKHEGGGWSSPKLLCSPSCRASSPQVALRADGQASAVWHAADLLCGSLAMYRPCISGENLVGRASPSGGVRLSWCSGSQNNILGYLIYRDGDFLQLVTGTSYTDLEGQAASSYKIVALTEDGEVGIPLLSSFR